MIFFLFMIKSNEIYACNKTLRHDHSYIYNQLLFIFKPFGFLVLDYSKYTKFLIHLPKKLIEQFEYVINMFLLTLHPLSINEKSVSFSSSLKSNDGTFSCLLSCTAIFLILSESESKVKIRAENVVMKYYLQSLVKASSYTFF